MSGKVKKILEFVFVCSKLSVTCGVVVLLNGE